MSTVFVALDDTVSASSPRRLWPVVVVGLRSSRAVGGLAVVGDDVGARPVADDAAVVEQDRALAQPRNRLHVVRDENHRAAGRSEILHPPEAAPLELGPAASTSSTSRISGSRCAATANASRTYIPLEYRFTGVSMNFSTPANSTISGNLRWISRRFIPSTAPFRKTFSRPVSSGWNPVPTSRRLPTRPRISARPSVGVVMRVNSFSKVDFPAPLRPMIPTTWPVGTSNEMSRSAQMS